MVCVMVSESLVGTLDVVCEDSEVEALSEPSALLEQPANAASENARHALNANVPAFLAKGVCAVLAAKGAHAALLAKRVCPALVFPLQDFIFPP